MLVNRLFCKFLFPKLAISPLFMMAAEKAPKAPKAQKAPPKQAKKEDGKNKGKGAQAQKAAQGAKKPEQAAKTQIKQEEVQINPVFFNYTRSGSHYRDLIRNINVRKKTKRATFSQKSLQIMVNMATKKDINLIFQAYYNFVGHHTKISNKTVDFLLQRSMKIAMKKPEVAEETFTKVFQVLTNHQYLCYFPHYQVTLRAGKFAEKLGKFDKFLQLLGTKFLIKLNQKSIVGLLQLAKDAKTFNRLNRIILFRFNRGLVTEAKKQNILKAIVSAVQRIQGLQIYNTGEQYQKFLSSFLQPSTDLFLGWTLKNPRSQTSDHFYTKLGEKNLKLSEYVLNDLKIQKGENKIDVSSFFQKKKQEKKQSEQKI